MEYTLALIKPDAVKAGKAAEMQQLMQLHDFSIIAKQQLQVYLAVACGLHP
jgi:nucleoside-diphosphate kinase